MASLSPFCMILDECRCGLGQKAERSHQHGRCGKKWPSGFRCHPAHPCPACASTGPPRPPELMGTSEERPSSHRWVWDVPQGTPPAVLGYWTHTLAQCVSLPSLAAPGIWGETHSFLRPALEWRESDVPSPSQVTFLSLSESPGLQDLLRSAPPHQEFPTVNPGGRH